LIVYTIGGVVTGTIGSSPPAGPTAENVAMARMAVGSLLDIMAVPSASA